MSYSEKEFEKVAVITKKMDKISPSFCLVRWKHATLNLASGASKSCCHHHFKPIQLNKHGEFQLHDNSEEQKLRREMLEGKRPKDCSYCWWVEDSGHASDRVNWSAKSWMAPSFDETTENISDKAAPPSWVELNFSSVCNLKCLYCSPIYSTNWYKEIKKFGPYPTSNPHNSISHLNYIEFEDNYENTELMEKFWPWFYETLPHIRLLKITGGEPLLSENTFKLMSILEKQNHPKLCLGINSNLSISDDKWMRFIESVKILEQNKSIDRIYLHPSLDSSAKRAEYIRHGLDYSVLQKNVETFLSETNGSVHFISTLNCLALGGLLDYWKYILELKTKYYKKGREIAIGTEVLQAPEWLNLNILDESMSHYFDEVISFVKDHINEDGSGFTQVELAGLEKAKSTMLSPSDNRERKRSDFYRFIKEVDKRRDSSFDDIFPELTSFMEICKANSERLENFLS
jgi:organic radical activating enzyme